MKYIVKIVQELSVADLKKPDKERPDKENHFEELLKKDNRTKSIIEKTAKLKEETKNVEWDCGDMYGDDCVGPPFDGGRLNKIENKTERKLVSVNHILNYFFHIHNCTFYIQARQLVNLEKYMEEVLNEGTLMHIYFKELGVVKYSRDELYGAMDVIGKNNTKSVSWDSFRSVSLA